MADQLMELARELKKLNARRKGGDTLSPEDDKRRKELKKYLKSALSKEKGTSEGSPVPGGVSGLQTSMESSAPKAKPPPAKKKSNPYAIGGVDDLLSMASQEAKGPSEDDEYATASIDDDEAGELGMSMDDGGALQSGKVPENKTKKDYSNAFAVDASNLFDDALGSDNVLAAAPTMEKPTDPAARGRTQAGKTTKLSGKDFADWLSQTSDGRAKMRNNGAAIEAAGKKADEALEANKTRDHVTKPEDVVLQLGDIMGGSGYTPPEAQLAHEQYYGEYVESEGFGYAELGQALDTLKPIDPREIELHRAGVLSDENDPAPVPGGLAFLDDFIVLYELGVVPPAGEEVNFDSDDPNLLIPGKRKVTVHLLNGQVKRGAIRTLNRGDMGFRLEPTGTGKAEDIPILHIKAIFVHLPSKGSPRAVEGRQITVMFKDRRSVAGVTDDYQPGVPMFSLVPPSGRGAQFERIIVNPQAIKQVR